MAELESMSPDITLFHIDITLFHILPRLPVKSVTRFKCVSKQWHSFITTDQFPKMHLVHRNQQKLLFLPHNKAWDFFTIDCETPEDGCTPFRPLPFKVRSLNKLMIPTSLHGMVCVHEYPQYSDIIILWNPVTDDYKTLSKAGSHKEISIASSLHGMVCVLLTNKTGYGHPIKVSDILLWNPVTGDHKTLSKAGSHRDCYETSEHQYGLYYSSSKDDYKIVCLTGDHSRVNVYIYSLKSDSWRKVESTGQCSNLYSYFTKRSVLLNEKLYFGNSYSIMMFDTESEKLRVTNTPHFGNQRTRCAGFMIVRDCIHFLLGITNSIGQYDMIEKWRMDGDGDGDGDWTKVETCSSEEHLYWSYEQHCHLMMNGNWLMYSDNPQHLTRNKNWLMHNTRGGCVYMLDAKNHTKHVMCSIKFSFRPEGRFIETFMSPNQFLK